MSSDSSKLLIDESPLQVLPTLAKLIGLNEAIILQQVHYWIGIAKKSKDPRKYKDDRWWVYNTYQEWQENFPWWSPDTIRRAIGKLEKACLLVSIEMNAQDWDHTKWYSIDYDALNAIIDLCNLHRSSDAESTDRSGQDAQILIESETTTEITPKTSAEEAESAGIPENGRAPAAASGDDGLFQDNLQALQDAGIAVNGTTRKLARLAHVTPEYIRRHAAAFNGDKKGLLIRKLLDADPPPAQPERWESSPGADPPEETAEFLTDLDKAWERVLFSMERFLGVKGRVTYQTYFAQTRLVDRKGSAFWVAVQSDYNKTWLESRGLSYLEQHLSAVLNIPEPDIFLVIMEPA